MTVVDLTSMAAPEGERRDGINAALRALAEQKADYCYQCGKCTGGCEAFILLELEPHKIMALTRAGFIDEMVGSDIIWTCMTCQKCRERCPQDTAPVQVLHILKNMAVLSGRQIGTGYTNMLQSVLGTGFMQMPVDVASRSGESRNRESLGLPPLQGPEDMEKFQMTVMSTATEQLR